jgi:hypothetical protein
VRLARHRRRRTRSEAVGLGLSSLPGVERGRLRWLAGEAEIERGRFRVVEWERRSGGYLCPRGEDLAVGVGERGGGGGGGVRPRGATASLVGGVRREGSVGVHWRERRQERRCRLLLE